MSIRNSYIVPLFISFTLYCNSSYCQQTEDILGDWNIIKVEIASNANPKEKQMLGTLTQIFSKSTFHFKNDSKFSFDSPDKDLAIKDAVWKFDKTKNYIEITERISKGKPSQLMGITVRVIEGRYSFVMEETSIVLSVIKKKG